MTFRNCNLTVGNILSVLLWLKLTWKWNQKSLGNLTLQKSTNYRSRVHMFKWFQFWEFTNRCEWLLTKNSLPYLMERGHFVEWQIIKNFEIIIICQKAKVITLSKFWSLHWMDTLSNIENDHFIKIRKTTYKSKF